MKYVATVHRPDDLEAAAWLVADAAGLVPAEARMRLSREPPALLAPLEAARADALAARLCQQGLAALAIDACVPSDKDRTVARTIALSPDGVTFNPHFGEPMQVGWSEVMAVLRGARESRRETSSVERVQRPSDWAAVATDGLWVTTNEKKTYRSSSESVHQLVLVFARDGRAAMVADDVLELTSLGAMMQPSSTASMVRLAHELRARAPQAFYDERLVRMGCRPLPLVVDGGSAARSSIQSVVRTDTTASFDVLAEVMRQALLAGLLP